MSNIGDRIHQLMEINGYTQKELAGMVGVTESAMSRYLNNTREPKLEVIANLSTALNTTSDYLISGKLSDDSFSDIYRLVARSTVSITDEEKMKLMKVLLNK